MDARGWQARPRNAQLASYLPLLACAFLAGLLCVYQLPSLPPLIGFVPLLAGAMLLWRSKKLLSLFLLTGLSAALYMTVYSQLRLADNWPVEQHGQNIQLAGHIHGIPDQDANRARFLFKSEGMGGLIRVSWYRNAQDVVAGQCWQFKLKMRSPHGSYNPGGFDYQGWLFRQGVIATAYVREAARCEDKTPWLLQLHGWRQRMADQIRDQLEGHDMTSVVLALTLGVRSDFTTQDWDMLRHTGTSHLMAISGLHIGLVAMLFWGIVSFIWRRSPWLVARIAASRAGACAGLAAAVVYTLLSGAGLPALRALLMFTVLILVLWSGRKASILQGLSIALIVILLFDPFAAASAGFWLSFCAVAAIAYLLSHRLRPLNGLPALISLQIRLGLVLLPITLFWFAEASLVSPAINLLLIPVFTLLVPFLLFATLVALLEPATGQWLLHAGAAGLDWIWFGLHWIDQGMATGFSRERFHLGYVLFSVLAVLWALAPSGWPARVTAMVLLSALLVFKSPHPSRPGSDAFQLTVLDVGQGLSVVVESQGKVLVFDAGPAFSGSFDAGEMVLLPFLRHRGYEKVDVLVLSHGDSDHRGGIPSLSKGMQIDQRYGPGRYLPGAQDCRAGQGWGWQSVRFEFLHPDSGGWAGNNASCVLKISTPSHSALITGDIEKTVERELISSSRAQLNTDVLVVPHHGSATSSISGFIKATSPAVAIVSSGWRNRWGFPRPEVVDRYLSHGVEFHNTAVSGALMLEISEQDGVGPVAGWRQIEPHFWFAGKNHQTQSRSD